MAMLVGAGSDALAKTHGGSSGSSSSAPSGGNPPPRSGTMPTGPRPYAGPRIYSGQNLYNPNMNVYRGVPNYVNGTKTLTYPAVRGSMTSIHAKTTGANHIKNNALGVSSQSDHAAGARNLQGTNHHTSSNQSLSANTRAKGVHNNRQTQSKLDPQTAHQLRNWNGKKDSNAEAQRNNREFRHEHHDRGWWRRHCAAIIFFDFGWWGWWDGWWYPAWGYDPYYPYYEYDQPIYGYDGLAPDQVVANVQSALQEQGYFSYAADGKMGPLTRAAIANYQRDHMLPITGNIDPATLGSLGLTN